MQRGKKENKDKEEEKKRKNKEKIKAKSLEKKKVFSSIRDDDAEAPERNASELLLAKTMRTNKEKAEQALKKITGQTSSI